MFPYLKVLIRQRISAWNPFTYRKAGQSKVKAVLGYIGFTLVALMLYGMLVVMEYFLYGAFSQMGEPQTMLALTGILCTLLVVVTGFFYVLNELFFSKDVAYVSSLPISSRGLLAAKMARIWLGEAGIALLVCLPVVILLGVEKGFGVLYYLGALLLIPLLSMVPLVVVAALSFLLIRISALWKRREALTIVMSMVFLIAFMYFEMRFSMSMDDESMRAMVLQLVLRQKQLLDLIVLAYPPVRWFTAALTQGAGGVLQLLAFVAVNVGAAALLLLLAGGAYQRLAVKQSEAFARMNARAKRRDERHGVRSPLMALYRRELREIVTVPIYAMNSLTQAVMFPVLAAAMLAGGSSSPELAAIPLMLALVPAPLLTAGATGLFAFVTSMNMAASTAVSREGKRHEFFQTLPVKPQTQMLAKLLMGLTINVISIVPIGVLAYVALPALRGPVIIGALASLLFSTATTAAALMLDAAHPKFGWKNETEAIKQNGLAAASMFIAMLFIAACGFGYYLLTTLGITLTQALLLVCAFAALLDTLLLHRLFGRTSRTYILQELRN